MPPVPAVELTILRVVQLNREYAILANHEEEGDPAAGLPSLFHDPKDRLLDQRNERSIATIK